MVDLGYAWNPATLEQFDIIATDDFEAGTRHEVNRWDDVRPFLCEMVRYLGGAIR